MTVGLMAGMAEGIPELHVHAADALPPSFAQQGAQHAQQGPLHQEHPAGCFALQGHFAAAFLLAPTDWAQP